MSGGCDLDWITDDLAVGGCCLDQELERLARDQDLGAVIDLRAEAVDDVEAWRRCGVDFLSLPTRDHAAISPPMLTAGLAFARTARGAGRRLLVHCQHGIGRSAMLALCVLVERGLDSLEALALVKARRTKASPSVAQLEAWRAWLADRGQAPPPFEACAAIVYARRGAS